MVYVCKDCGHEIEKFDGFVRCPYCACRIVYKPSARIVRTVKAR